MGEIFYWNKSWNRFVLFHLQVEKASRIMQLLIDNFGVARVFGQHNIEYFAEATHIEIHVRETFKYQYSYPADDILPRKWKFFLFYR